MCVFVGESEAADAVWKMHVCTRARFKGGGRERQSRATQTGERVGAADRETEESAGEQRPAAQGSMSVSI